MARRALGSRHDTALEQLGEQVAEEIDAAVKRAAEAPYPTASEVFDHV